MVWVLKRLELLASRFHLLSEFDEGKRSCRRRLAGHNRRRRKTQPEEITSRVASPGNCDNASNNANMDIMALLTALACAQGTYLGSVSFILLSGNLVLVMFNE